MRNVIGILLDRKTYLGILQKQTGYEHIDYYNKAAIELEMTPFYMCLKHISTKTALGLCYENKKYTLKRLPIPKVIHNRAMTLSTFSQKKLKDLAKISQIFNGQNRHDKLRIHRMLRASSGSSAFLPSTIAYTRNNLDKAISRYDSFFVKPTNSSVGIGVLKVSAMPGQIWQVWWSKQIPKQLNKEQTIDFIDEKVRGKSYLIQKTIPLAMYEGRPYDLRVSVQRGDKGQWGVTGIAGKIAANGRHVTNLARGGEAMICENLFRSNGFDPIQKREQVEKAALQIAESLSEKIPSMSDVGMDIGIDDQGEIWLIEINGRDQRYQYKHLNLNKTFYRTYETPMLYAKYLLGK
ncbi:YheC/YheD family protein [Paenibacillus qinlingensis]|uniref:Glutathione synthase/RimK-type ligase-like ATP-grasp enzyme n=1 Tax=Paenibacillus qinlingensis TaxID=1837343 RepID=A0ABU1NQT9_9BACL|nr:YheC/YheD family protein [Paenibacillus qinlingensis]MDR6549834.1 glutathione synthase/RimK-type ligase-like ATP-grasp enzyme [Paenibacillus qinlingensis]